MQLPLRWLLLTSFSGRGCKRRPSRFGLGPILFLIYVTDLADNLTINRLLYADDGTLIIPENKRLPFYLKRPIMSQLLFLSRRKTRSDLIGVCQIVHGILDFPWDTVFVTPSSGPRDHTFSGVTVDVASMSSTFKQAARGDCERFACCDIQDKIRRSMAVPVF